MREIASLGQANTETYNGAQNMSVAGARANG